MRENIFLESQVGPESGGGRGEENFEERRGVRSLTEEEWSDGSGLEDCSIFKISFRLRKFVSGEVAAAAEGGIPSNPLEETPPAPTPFAFQNERNVEEGFDEVGFDIELRK